MPYRRRQSQLWARPRRGASMFRPGRFSRKRPSRSYTPFKYKQGFRAKRFRFSIPKSFVRRYKAVYSGRGKYNLNKRR